jgi:hypothetical protein
VQVWARPDRAGREQPGQPARGREGAPPLQVRVRAHHSTSIPVQGVQRGTVLVLFSVSLLSSVPVQGVQRGTRTILSLIVKLSSSTGSSERYPVLFLVTLLSSVPVQGVQRGTRTFLSHIVKLSPSTGSSERYPCYS